MGSSTASFRVGRVRVYLRGRVWYLSYWEQGHRRQPRVGSDRGAAKQLAAEINGQLEAGAPSALRFQPISIPDLRQHWLDQHEHIRRSSIHTIRRYRSATEHLLDFLRDVRPLARAFDSHELRILLADRIGEPGQYERSENNPNRLYLPLAGANCRIVLTFCGRKIISVAPGPDFDRTQWDANLMRVRERRFQLANKRR